MDVRCRGSARQHSGTWPAGVNDSGDIPWRTTGGRAGAEDVLPAKVANRAGDLPDKIVTFDRQGTALSENDVDGERLGGGSSGNTKTFGTSHHHIVTARQFNLRNSQNLKTTRNFHNPQSFVFLVVSHS